MEVSTQQQHESSQKAPVRSLQRPGRVPRAGHRFTLNDAGERNVERLKRFYLEQIGQDVSLSLIVRRALEVLDSQVQQAKVSSSGVARELAGIMRQMK